jgi:hypothetical protein
VTLVTLDISSAPPKNHVFLCLVTLDTLEVCKVIKKIAQSVSVCLATGYGMDGRGGGVPVAVGVKIFVLSTSS